MFLLITLLIVGCIFTGVFNGHMWGAGEDPKINYNTDPTLPVYNGGDNSGYDSSDGIETPTGGEFQYGTESATNPNKADYEGKFIMSAETSQLIGHRDRTYFLFVNEDGTFYVRTDYQVDGEYEYEIHRGTYKAVSDTKLKMTLTEFETSIGKLADDDKYKKAKEETVTLKGDELICKRGKDEYLFKKLM